MLARSRELIRCRCVAGGVCGANVPATSSSIVLPQHQSRIFALDHYPTRASGCCSNQRHNSTSIASSSATSLRSSTTGLSTSAADLAFVSSLAAHFQQQQHHRQQIQTKPLNPVIFPLHHNHRRSPFAHSKPRVVVSAHHPHKAKARAQVQPKLAKSRSSNRPGFGGSGHNAAVKVTESHKQQHTVEEEKECELPMDMECGCKTKRLKEQQEAEALAKAAAARVQVISSSSNQIDDVAVQSVSSSVVVVRNSNPALENGVKAGISYESSFHRRHLPQDCIAFSSPEGRKLFTQALNRMENNYMQIYFPLAEQFITQAEPAFCGLATLAMCLNALQIDPGRLWKGPWRWFSEELFDCCTSLSVAKEKGISLSEFICLARCNGVHTDDMRADSNLSLDQFRSIVKHSCSTSNEIVVLNYSRKVLGQTGDGHFSPIGGYHEENDMVLLLDVARFKYPPHWVRLPLVYEAMQKIDQSIGLPRGLVVLKENAHATGPTLVKQLVHSAHPELPVKPAPSPCCNSASSIESARRVAAFTNPN
uniref:glutathione gamma-glutamylcysteinyltransferase n=1 Tax=Globisporangium ultimum (strain ATCC 200006 / CBS 805.95 / DAOM BR144) TaxID=431595 RepID=K3WJ27_GLOUD